MQDGVQTVLAAADERPVSGIHTVESLREIEHLVSATPVPMLVVDYTPIIERYKYCSVGRIAALLESDDELSICVGLPVHLGMSREWNRLFGVPGSLTFPAHMSRNFDASAYPDLRRALVAQFLAPFRKETSIVSEHLVPTMDGAVIVRSHWMAPIRDGEPDYTRIVIVDIDITDLRETERSLEETLETKDRLVASISHELRNPLTSVLGFSSLLANDWDSLDDETRRSMASDMVEQVGDVAAIVDDLLALYGGRKLQMVSSELTLGAVLAGVDCDNVELLVDEDVAVRGDQLRIRQILRNLIRNAQRHGGEHIELRSIVRRDHIALEVCDTGMGVPDDLLAGLFHPFTKGGASGSMGLGLSVSRDLARAMRGDLTYERRDGWSVFTVVLRSV